METNRKFNRLWQHPQVTYIPKAWIDTGCYKTAVLTHISPTEHAQIYLQLKFLHCRYFIQNTSSTLISIFFIVSTKTSVPKQEPNRFHVLF